MLDLTGKNKTYLSIKMPDETIILVRQPTKRVLDALLELDEKMHATDLTDADGVREIYALLAEILSCNASRTPIELEYLEMEIDMVDLRAIYNAYVDFISGIANDPA